MSSKKLRRRGYSPSQPLFFSKIGRIAKDATVASPLGQAAILTAIHTASSDIAIRLLQNSSTSSTTVPVFIEKHSTKTV